MNSSPIDQHWLIRDLDIAEVEVADGRDALIAGDQIWSISDTAVEDIEAQEPQLGAGDFEIVPAIRN